MGFKNFAFEAFKEQIFVNVVKRAWDFARSLVTDQVMGATKEKVKEIIDHRGWDDESYFAQDLAESGLDPGKKKIILDGIRLAEKCDRKRGTRTARNFRILVTIHDYDERKQRVNDPPGVKIIKEIGEQCENAREVFLYIEALGAMHDPNISFEKFVHVFKTSLLPFLIQQKENIKQIKEDVSQTIADYADAIEEEYEKKCWWKKIPKIGGLFK